MEAKYRQEQKDKGQDKEEVAKENFPTSEQDDKMFTFASALTRSEKESQRLMGIELLLSTPTAAVADTALSLSLSLSFSHSHSLLLYVTDKQC